ncbi:MAG TPA: 4-vinyl reductase [Nitrososphaerales archaeon]|nr:4-vinyl reductase [Nitrososphaerales archaeon]
MFRGKKKEEPVKEDVFDVDLEHGAVTRKVDGSRVMMMGSHGWATIERELESTFVTGAAVIMQRVGYSYGRAMGRAARNQQLPPEQTFEQMQELARESGWGQFTLSSGDLFGGMARITVRDCFFCLHARESTERVCFVLAGLVGGIADELIGSTHRVTEERCIAKGDAVCEVLVERVG